MSLLAAQASTNAVRSLYMPHVQQQRAQEMSTIDPATFIAASVLAVVVAVLIASFRLIRQLPRVEKVEQPLYTHPLLHRRLLDSCHLKLGCIDRVL